jgi:hypothetical protein
MSKVHWLCFTAAGIQAAMGLWLIEAAKTASDDDFVQCHEPLVATVQGRLPLHPRASD